MDDERSDFDLSQYIPDSLLLGASLAPETNQRACVSKKQKYRFDYLHYEDPLSILGETGDWIPHNVPENVIGSPIQEFYRGLNIFITGGTGFLGKVLFQKLIRSIPHIGQVYLLIRPKKGKSPQERFHEVLEDKLFLRMKAEVPGYAYKITVVEGDISQPGLGLSAADHHMLCDNIHVVFHSAADVRFIEPLKSAVLSNVVGSKRVLDLGKEIRNLKVYVHVSTAYSHCVRRVIEEKCYTMNVHYQDIINYVESKTDEEVEAETERLLQGWPNTYTFSKALCESMLQEEATNMPLCIYRPTVVWSTDKDPVSGWTDNIYGPIGMFMAVVMGVIRIYHVDENSWLDCVPVDLVANSIIAVGRHVAIMKRPTDSIEVFNFSGTPQNPVTWKRLKQYANRLGNLFALSSSIWCMSLFCTNSGFIFEIGHFFLHKIPGKILDTIAVLAGQKARLSKIYDKILFMKDNLEFFVFGYWDFKNEKIGELWNRQHLLDQELFPFDVGSVDMEKFALIGKLGLRYYVQKESMESLPDAMRKHRWLEWAHYTLLTLCGLLALKPAVMLARFLPI